MDDLYFDLGNTSLKVYSDGGKLAAVFSSLRSSWLSETSAFICSQDVKRVVIASVATEEKLDLVLNLLKGISVTIASYDKGQWRVINGYANPERLGIDRLLAIEAAYFEIQDRCLVIDCGSAITLDAVDASGCHIGGYIVPGYRLQMESLLRDTSLSFDSIEPTLEMGLDTSECIRNGALRMIFSFCVSVIDEIKPARVFLTGGDLKGALKTLEGLGVRDDFLVYKGLKRVYG